MRLPLRLLEEVTGHNLSADQVVRHLERVGFPVEEVIELLPYDPEIRTARVTGVVKSNDDGVLLTVETEEERYYAYSHVEVAPGEVVALGFIKSPLAEKVLKQKPDAAALVLVEKDLGFEDDRPVILPKDTPLGCMLFDVVESTVLDVEITPNRGDLYSVYGLARELSVLLGERFTPPQPPVVDITRSKHPFRLEIEAQEDVIQYYGFVIDGVRIKESPFWLRWMLYAFGARPVNNVVDVSNYVMFLTGQPLHAFDVSNIRGSLVKVRRANNDEAFTAIDHRDYKLSEDCLMIADKDHSLALAGVMGGLDSEVGALTTGLFLESAEFTPKAVRRSISRTALQSDSSKRFAAGIDGAIVRNAALVFIETLAGVSPDVTVKGELVYGQPPDKGSLTLSFPKLEAYAAIAVDREKARRNMELIGFEVENVKDSLTLKVPSHRNDMLEDVDAIEEILRLEGYDNLPSRFIIHSQRRGRRDPLSKRINLVREFLTGMGLSEIYSLSLIPGGDVPQDIEDQVVPVNNPLSERMGVLRPSLLPGMLAVASSNIRFGMNDLGFYEIGHVFKKVSGHIDENLHLGILLTGKSTPLDWNTTPRDVDFFDLKGIVDAFLLRFAAKEALFEKNPVGYLDDEACRVIIDTMPVMEVGRVSADLLERFEIAQQAYFCVVNLSLFEKVMREDSRFEPLPRFRAVERDIALLLDADYSAADVVQFVRQEAGELCRSVDVFDSFSGSPLPEGKRNLGLRLSFVPREGNFSKEELDSIVARVGKIVATKFNAVVRGREGDGN